ncbi:MAG: DVU_1557 family redox protein [Geobacteraceae bacterium]
MNFSHEAAEWTCSCCKGPLLLQKVYFSYMKGKFEVDLPACGQCGNVLVPESLALGKMAEAERILEDK